MNTFFKFLLWYVVEKALRYIVICIYCMKGHHIYKDVWVPDPMRPEILTCMQEAGNDADPYSVARINSLMNVVGHEYGRRMDT